MKVNTITSAVLFAILALTSCRDLNYSPKPRGYFRVEFPQKIYYQPKIGCPFKFEIPHYSEVLQDTNLDGNLCWKNIDFPNFNARLHLSYFTMNDKATLQELSEDARTFVFKHTAKATAIDQSRIHHPEKDVYGLLYHIHGNTASSYQFYLSDSSMHYLRAALYFNERPNVDSIKPVLEFIKKDIDYMISTFEWK